MIDKRTLFEIHRLAHEGLSMRQIARALGLLLLTAVYSSILPVENSPLDKV
jgi:hypothetical protein